MALILSLETSTTVCSAALHDNGKLLESIELLTPQSASAQLAPSIDNLFKSSGRSIAHLGAVAVASGPGSYTGLRIGVATAKGICYGLGISLISVNTLELMAYQMVADEKYIQTEGNNVFLCPMLDARRMEVYCLLADTHLNLIESTQAKIIDHQSFGEWLDRNPVIFFGNGADKCKQIIIHPNARFRDGIVPSASKLGELAFQKFITNEIEDLSSFEPHYLKEFMVKKPKTV